MMPSAYTNFLVASTQASAALIGLLFVAISIAPERVFGATAESTRKAMALSSFTALANVFFVSFGSLIPDLRFGVMVVVAGAVALSQTISLLTLIRQWRHEGSIVRGIALFLISAGLYTYEVIVGAQFLYGAATGALYTGVETLMLGIFAVGLARAWELLGAPQGRGLVGLLTGWLERRAGDKTSTAERKGDQSAT
jgi:hypothetical protein